jgi:hypothetical protein
MSTHSDLKERLAGVRIEKQRRASLKEEENNNAHSSFALSWPRPKAPSSEWWKDLARAGAMRDEAGVLGMLVTRVDDEMNDLRNVHWRNWTPLHHCAECGVTHLLHLHC